MTGLKNAQMTTFIILGVVILLFSSIGFFLYKQVTISGFEKKVDTVAEQMKIAALDAYVESCLRGALLENLDAVGLRGGFLGDVPHRFEHRGTMSVAIPLFEHYGEEFEGTEYLPVPDYPNRIVRGARNEFHIQPISPYPFGGRSLPKLCQTGGPNDAPLHEFAKPCPRGSYGTESIQHDLNVRVAQGLDACVDPEYINEITGYDIKVGSPIVSVILGEDDVRAEAEYPFTIEIDGSEAIRTFEFAADASVRIKKVYGLAQHIINNDRFYVTYDKRDMESSEWQSEFWDRAMTVNIDCPGCPEDQTDVVTITDTRSDLDGKYLLFRFAVTDRIPVLEPIRGPSATEEFDFVLTNGATLRIEPLALDSDEDELYVYYRGWMQDYITIRGTEVRLPAADYRPPGGDGFAPLLGRSPCRLDANFDERSVACDRAITIHPSIFERRGDAWSEIFNPHEGEHGLTVIVCDKEIASFPVYLDDNGEHKEHCDWQKIRIQVGAGTPVLETGVGCYYEGVAAEDCISLEDPVVLETTGASGTFAWTSPKDVLFTRIPSRAIIPDDVIEGYVSDITAMFPELATDTPALTLDNIRRHKIKWIKWFLESEVFTGTGRNAWTLDAGGMTETVTMDVSECIPYGDPITNPPYPYNLPGDPFTAAHMCCKDDGTLKQPTDRDNVCYSGTTYGPPDFSTLAEEGHDNRANDVYEKRVTHLCDGVRGNMCTPLGEKSEDISHGPPLADCNDFDILGQAERCEGPSVTTRPGTDILTYACKQYEPGESFEEEFGLAKRGSAIDANGNCAGTPDYADSGGAGMFNPTTNSGPFRCEGQCNAGLCNYAANCVCDSRSPSGAGDRACDGITYSVLAASAGRGVANAAGTAWCDIGCRVVGPDESEAACRAAIGATDGGTWESRSYSSGRPAGQRCCGDAPAEFLPGGPGNACCSAPGSCVIGSACVAPGDTTPDGRYYCDGGVSKLCSITQECARSSDGSTWCDGERWSPDPAPRSSLEGRICGRGDLCAECRFNPHVGRTECVGGSPDPDCPASAPVCRLVGTSFQCEGS